MSAPRKTKTPQGDQAEGAFKTTSSTIIFTELLELIKPQLLVGKDVRLIDFLPEQRPVVIGVMAQLRDELPIRSGWQTVRESHLSETRLRARRYSIDGAFLIGGEDHV